MGSRTKTTRERETERRRDREIEGLRARAKGRTHSHSSRRASAPDFPEIERLLKEVIPNAERVLVFDHALRTGGPALSKEFTSNKGAGWGPCGLRERSVR